MDELPEIKKAVETVLGLFLERPEDLHVSLKEITDDRGTLKHVIVRVSPVDVAKCIGKEGSTAEAVRRIVSLVAIKHRIPHFVGYKVDHASSDRFKKPR